MVLDFVGLASSTYYDHIKREKANIGNKEAIVTSRPVPGFSLNKAGLQVFDEEIKSLIMEYIAGDGPRKLAKKATVTASD